MYLLDMVVIFILIILNGFLAMTEFAIVSSNRNKLKNLSKTSKGAQIALTLTDNPGVFLSTIQIGITVIGIVSGAFSGQRFAEPLGIWLNNFAWVHGYGQLFAYSLIVLLITYVSLIIGELIPKRLALSRSESIASLFAPIIFYLSKVSHPFVKVLDTSTKILLSFLRQDNVKQEAITEEEIQSILKQSFEEGTIDPFEHHLFDRVLKFGDRDASIMMTPRLKLVSLNLKDDPEMIKKIVISTPHRFYPVFENKGEGFLGVVDIKDIMILQMKEVPLELNSILKDIPCIIEGAHGSEVYTQFRKNKAHIGAVVDEYGELQGLITMTDIFETLVGELSEESKKTSDEIVQRDDGSWLCDGLTPIDDIEDLLETKIVSAFKQEDFNTLAGFILVHFKKIPKVGESFLWKRFKFEVVDLDGKRIDKVLIKKEELHG